MITFFRLFPRIFKRHQPLYSFICRPHIWSLGAAGGIDVSSRQLYFGISCLFIQVRYLFSHVCPNVHHDFTSDNFNNPARDILMGLIPESLRAVLRPFLRGTVVRVGLLLGSGMILISEKFFHPRYLSLVAIPFAAAWLASVFSLKRNIQKSFSI